MSKLLYDLIGLAGIAAVIYTVELAARALAEWM